MSNLFRKVWESVSNRANSSKSGPISSNFCYASSSNASLSDQIIMCASSTGEFDRIPLDVFMQIVKLLQPNEVARLTAVCKLWKLIVSDNRLWMYYLQNQLVPWESIFFSEINLRSGLPLQTCSQMQSFMNIYGLRAQVPGAIIIDGGSGYCKFGWSKFDSPSGRSATFLEFGNIETPMYSRLRHFFATIYNRMQVKSSTQPIVVSIPLCQYDDTEAAKAARRQLKEAIHSALFGMNVPSVCAVSQATLALFAAKRTSGIVVNIGFHQTSVVPILHGKIMRKVGVEAVGVGALKLTGYLREQMQQRNLHFDSLYTVRSLKENLCYVALDYEAELCKDTEASYEVAAAGWFTLARERFQTGEILFQPRIAGMRAMGLHQAVALCIDHCHAAELTADESWFKTIVLAGGTACLPGVAGAIMAETIPFKNLQSREYQGHKKKVHSVAWNCNGTKLASGSVDQTARVWHIEPHGHSKVKDVELKGHTDSVDQLCWDPKHADLVATASGDKTVRLWDVRSGKCSQQAELSGENINITYKPDGTHVAVGNRDDELTILDVRKFKLIHKRKFNYEVNEIAWNMTGDKFFLTTGNGTVEVLAYPSLRAVDTLTAHTAGCYCIAIDPLGRYFAVGSADSLVSIWDISEMLCVRTFTKLEWPVRTISFNHTGEYIASASEDLFIDISNVQTGRSVHQIPCRAAMNSVEWNPKFNLLAYAGDDKNKYQADEGVFRIFGFDSA